MKPRIIHFFIIIVFVFGILSERIPSSVSFYKKNNICENIVDISTQSKPIIQSFANDHLRDVLHQITFFQVLTSNSESSHNSYNINRINYLCLLVHLRFLSETKQTIEQAATQYKNGYYIHFLRKMLI